MPNVSLAQLRVYRTIDYKHNQLLSLIAAKKGETDEFPFSDLITASGVGDALLCIGVLELSKSVRIHLTADFAEHALLAFKPEQPEASPAAARLSAFVSSLQEALDTARRYADGKATEQELGGANAVAWYWRNRAPLTNERLMAEAVHSVTCAHVHLAATAALGTVSLDRAAFAAERDWQINHLRRFVEAYDNSGMGNWMHRFRETTDLMTTHANDALRALSA